MKIVSVLINKAQFNPGFIGLFTNPFYFARKGLYTEIKKQAHQVEGSILDIGCGRKPYKTLFYKASSYLGVDIDNNPGHDHKNEDIDVFYDGKVLPFIDQHFDNIVCFQVLEHVFNPDEFLKEINRVLKLDGFFLLAVPFIWDEHEQPYDYARYSSFGLKHLLVKNGFTVVQHTKSCQDIRVIFQLLIGRYYKLVKHSNLPTVLQYLILLPITLFFNILGSALSLISANDPDLYLDNIILAKKN